MQRCIFCFLFIFLVACPAWAVDKNRVDVQVLSRSSQSWDRKTLPEYPDGEPEIQILRITIPAGAKLPMHMHPVINAGVLLAGELTVITEQEKTLHLKAGDPIIEVVNTWHYGQNQGEEPAEIIVFYAGTKDLPVTINRDGF